MKKLLLYTFILLTVCSCRKLILENDPPNTPRSNFEYLWKTMNERYSFFAYKHVNWDSIYTIYSPKINDKLDDIQLFNVLSPMLNELRDAHVNLTSPFNMSRYENIFLSSPENIDNRIVNKYYLGTSYFTTGSFKHQFVAQGTIGYIRYESFSNSVSDADIEFIVNRFKDTEGLILDIRSNGGGYVNNVFTIGSHFADTSRLIYLSYIKNGPGYHDFASPDQVFLSPSGNRYTKKICILTNRGCYSATSFFVLAMRVFPHVCVVGDTTGGGLGAPTGAELPNGWGFRFPITQTLDPKGQNYEDGIPPDITCFTNSKDALKGIDTIIERAIAFIKAK